MNTSAIRQQLHNYIDAADDKKIEAIYTLLESNTDFKSNYSNEELAGFYKSRESYFNGSNPGITMEEAHEYIRKTRPNNDV